MKHLITTTLAIITLICVLSACNDNGEDIVLAETTAATSITTSETVVTTNETTAVTTTEETATTDLTTPLLYKYSDKLERKNGFDNPVLTEYYKEDIEQVMEWTTAKHIEIYYWECDLNSDEITDYIVSVRSPLHSGSHGDTFDILLGEEDGTFKNIADVAVLKLGSEEYGFSDIYIGGFFSDYPFEDILIAGETNVTEYYLFVFDKKTYKYTVTNPQYELMKTFENAENAETVKKLYYEELSKYVDETGWSFNIFDINKDGTPELLLSEGLHHFATVEIYTVYDGELKDLGDYGSYGEVYYDAENEYIYTDFQGTGGGFYGVYKLENGEMITVVGFLVDYEYVRDENDDLDVAIVLKINGEEVSEDVYNAEKKKYSYVNYAEEVFRSDEPTRKYYMQFCEFLSE